MGKDHGALRGAGAPGRNCLASRRVYSDTLTTNTAVGGGADGFRGSRVGERALRLRPQTHPALAPASSLALIPGADLARTLLPLETYSDLVSACGKDVAL